MPRQLAQQGIAALIGLGAANGVLLGAALAASHRGHALFVAMLAGTFINLTFLLGCQAAAKQ